MASRTRPDNRGLVITIMMVAPTNSMKLRSAIETEAPTADLICVVSAVSREISSPERGERKKPGEAQTKGAKRAPPRPAFRGRLRQFRFDRGYLGRFQIAPRRRFAMPVFKPFHCAHELSTNRFCHPQIGTAASRGKSGKMLIREHTCQILLRSLACFGGV